eukprot:671762-Prorocentrum_minimum.AAC.1
MVRLWHTCSHHGRRIDASGKGQTGEGDHAPPLRAIRGTTAKRTHLYTFVIRRFDSCELIRRFAHAQSERGAPGIFSLPFRDWCPLRVYALSPLVMMIVMTSAVEYGPTEVADSSSATDFCR